MLRELVSDRGLAAERRVAFAVTPALREWYTDDDLESLEYAAMTEAARASLRLLDVDPTAARRRVVIAAEVLDASVELRDDIERGVVHVAGALSLDQVESIHVDDADAEPAVAAATSVVLEADLGDPTAQDLVDDVEGFELAWYARQEIGTWLELQ
jgi:hypothetical protein